MKKYTLFLFSFILIYFPFFSEDTKPEMIIESNAAYLTLSALSTNKNNILMIFPVYSQVMITEYLSIDPSIVYIYSRNSQTEYESSMILVESGLSLHPNKSLRCRVKIT